MFVLQETIIKKTITDRRKMLLQEMLIYRARVSRSNHSPAALLSNTQIDLNSNINCMQKFVKLKMWLNIIKISDTIRGQIGLITGLQHILGYFYIFFIIFPFNQKRRVYYFNEIDEKESLHLVCRHDCGRQVKIVFVEN